MDERAKSVACPTCGAQRGIDCVLKRVNSISLRIMQHRARIELAVRTIKIEHWTRERAVRALAEESGSRDRAPKLPFTVPNTGWIANPVTGHMKQINTGDRISWENGRVIVRDASGKERK